MSTWLFKKILISLKRKRMKTCLTKILKKERKRIKIRNKRKKTKNRNPFRGNYRERSGSASPANI